MTTFMLPPSSLDEAASELRTRRQALFVPAPYAIPASGNDVVDTVSHCAWQNAHHNGRLPGPPELAGDEERGATPAEHPGVTRPIVRQNVKRRQFVRVAAETFDDCPSGVALERSKGKNSAAIVLEEELEQTAAQPADSVVQNEVNAVRS
jgi:hypothetical protein